MQEVQQWIVTLTIISLLLFVFRVVYWLALTSMDNPAFLFVNLIAGIFVLYVFCRDYVEDLIDLSKI